MCIYCFNIYEGYIDFYLYSMCDKKNYILVNGLSNIAPKNKTSLDPHNGAVGDGIRANDF